MKITIPVGEHASAAGEVGDRAGGQQQGGERQRVGVDHPLQVGEGRVERALDLRQRHVHDRDVEQQHEDAGADGDQRPPLASHVTLRSVLPEFALRITSILSWCSEISSNRAERLRVTEADRDRGTTRGGEGARRRAGARRSARRRLKLLREHGIANLNSARGRGRAPASPRRASTTTSATAPGCCRRCSRRGCGRSRPCPRPAR